MAHAATLRLKPGLVYRAIDEHEAALLDVETRGFFALNPTGLFIVEQLKDGCSAPELARAVAARFSTSARACRADVDRFVAELRNAGMLEATTGAESAQTPTGQLAEAIMPSREA